MIGEIKIQILFFISIFILVALWEHLAPRRALTTSKKICWFRILTLTILNPLLLRLIFPVLTINMAIIAREREWGLLNSAALFNHGNVPLSRKIDRILRYIVVTPDMHRVHHSVIIRETNSNYGFNLPWWDRRFGTYCDQPAKGHTDMTIGLSQFREPKKLTLPWLLILPFIGDPGKQPINRH